jgi:hypothetical protein
MKTVELFAMTWLATSVGAHAQEPPHTDDAVPSMELLEFLGEWQTAKGEFVDPLQMQDPEFLEAEPKGSEGKSHD